MKKISFFTFLLFACAYTFAQSTYSSKPTRSSSMHFGIKGGVNLAEFLRNDFSSGMQPNVNMKTSFHGGFFMNTPLGTGGLALQPELLYNGAGSKITTTTTTYVGTVATTTTNSYDQVMHYAALPILLQWKSAGGFLIETGPVPAYLINAKQKGPNDTKTDNKGNFDKFDFSWAGGIGFMTGSGLGIGARYNFGLTNVLAENNPNSGYAANGKLKNSVIQIGLSWGFGGK